MSESAIMTDWQPHPWVSEGGGRVRIGVGVTTRAASPEWSQIQRLVQALDERGVDSFWQPDHPAFTHDCWLMLAAVATHTRRLRLGPLVSSAGYRPPALLARQAADLDRLSAGRAILGLGAGWVEIEYPLLGMPFPPMRDRHQLLRETVEVVHGLWASRPTLSREPVEGAVELFPTIWVRQPFTYAGQFARFERAYQLPSPVQQPRPPVLIGGSGERVTLRLVAQYADMANFEEMRVKTPEAVAAKLDVLRRHCAEFGRPFETLLPSYFLNGALLAPTEERLAAKVAALPPLFQGGATNAATPAALIAKLRPVLATGIRYFVFNLTGYEDLETVELLVERVLPELQCH